MKNQLSFPYTVGHLAQDSDSACFLASPMHLFAVVLLIVCALICTVKPVVTSVVGLFTGSEIKAPSAENPDLSKVLCIKPAVGHDIALHASPAARKSIFCFSGSFIFLFSRSCQL